jgi:hypothetical protein
LEPELSRTGSSIKAGIDLRKTLKLSSKTETGLILENIHPISQTAKVLNKKKLNSLLNNKNKLNTIYSKSSTFLAQRQLNENTSSKRVGPCLRNYMQHRNSYVQEAETSLVSSGGYISE